MADEIGHSLRAWRERQDPRCTQVQLAARVGVDQTTLSQFEAGKYRLSEEKALAIEDATGGEIKAEDCVRDDRRVYVTLLRQSREAQKGAA